MWRRFLNISAMIAIVVAIVAGTVYYTLGYLAEKMPRTTAALDERKDFEDMAHANRIRPRAREAYHGFEGSLQKADKIASWKLNAKTDSVVKDFQDGKISRTEAFKALRDSGAEVRELEKSLRLTSAEVYQLQQETGSQPSKSYADEILDSGFLKSLLVIIALLTALILPLTIWGKISYSKGIWVLALMWIGFVLVKEIAKSDVWHDMGQKSPTGAAAAQQPPAQRSGRMTSPYTFHVKAGQLSDLVPLPGGTNFECDYPGKWIDWVFFNGKIVRRTKAGERLAVDNSGNVLGRYTGPLPDRALRVRSPVDGTVTFSW